MAVAFLEWIRRRLKNVVCPARTNRSENSSRPTRRPYDYRRSTTVNRHLRDQAGSDVCRAGGHAVELLERNALWFACLGKPGQKNARKSRIRFTPLGITSVRRRVLTAPVTKYLGRASRGDFRHCARMQGRQCGV